MRPFYRPYLLQDNENVHATVYVCSMFMLIESTTIRIQLRVGADVSVSVFFSFFRAHGIFTLNLIDHLIFLVLCRCLLFHGRHRSLFVIARASFPLCVCIQQFSSTHKIRY